MQCRHETGAVKCKTHTCDLMVPDLVPDSDSVPDLVPWLEGTLHRLEGTLHRLEGTLRRLEGTLRLKNDDANWSQLGVPK